MIYLHDREELTRPSRTYKPVKWPTPVPALYDMMAQYLEGRSLSIKLARANGWYPAYDNFGFPRIVIPCRRRDGKPYWQARDMSKQAQLRYTSPFTPRGDAIVRLVSGQPEATSLAICEGPMDALAAIGTGRFNSAMALMGVDPGESVWSHVRQVVVQYNHVDVIADSDALDVVSKTWLPNIARVAKSLKLVLPGHAKDFADLTPEDRLRVLSQ